MVAKEGDNVFTGIVEELGEILDLKKENESAKIYIKCKKVLENLSLGDSIAVNGVCLTAVEYGTDYFIAEIMPETLENTNFETKVNLERALTLNKPLGGHIVTGHVDGMGKIISVTPKGIAKEIKIQVSRELANQIIKKGSVAIDGISLTCITVGPDFFSVGIIPHTMEFTSLSTKKVGSIVNIETDYLGKYVQKFLGQVSDNKTGIDLNTLEKYGFA